MCRYKIKSRHHKLKFFKKNVETKKLKIKNKTTISSTILPTFFWKLIKPKKNFKKKNCPKIVYKSKIDIKKNFHPDNQTGIVIVI